MKEIISQGLGLTYERIKSISDKSNLRRKYIRKV